MSDLSRELMWTGSESRPMELFATRTDESLVPSKSNLQHQKLQSDIFSMIKFLMNIFGKLCIILSFLMTLKSWILSCTILIFMLKNCEYKLARLLEKVSRIKSNTPKMNSWNSDKCGWKRHKNL